MADAAIWSKRVAAWRASGQTAAVYCEQHGLSVSSLRYWAQDKRERPAAATTVRLARVERVAADPPVLSTISPAVVIEIGGARIRVERGVDAATVATVLAALGAGGRR
jgi:hypothetical protein